MGFKTRRVARSALFLVFASLFWNLLSAQDNCQFKIFQFPADKIFTIDDSPWIGLLWISLIMAGQSPGRRRETIVHLFNCKGDLK